MNVKIFAFLFSIVLLQALPLSAQEEEAELRDHFSEIGFELRENLDELLYSKSQLEQEQDEASENEEEMDLVLLG